jgi:hypothetical protein
MAAFDMLINLCVLLAQKWPPKNSKNSNIPPSADPNREKASKAKGERKPGGQAGHPGTVEDGLVRLEIDSLGLECHDREILTSIIERYGGGPVGGETLAISVGEAVDTLEDYYEPYLIQSGLL